MYLKMFMLYIILPIDFKITKYRVSNNNNSIGAGHL